MNKNEADILKTILENSYINQRQLAKISGYSLGSVNKAIKNLICEEYLDEQIKPTDKAKRKILSASPKNAIILAAGFGMRMPSMYKEIPKAFLEARGELLIERQIQQLHAVGINEIYVVVGYMKEKFEYLIDRYGVELVVNRDYDMRNNLYSLYLVHQHISNTYIVPCDIWTKDNPFNHHELYSWYMVSDSLDQGSDVRANRKFELISASGGTDGNRMIGISYITHQDSHFVKRRILELCSDRRNDGMFWEEALYKEDRMIVKARVVNDKDVEEFSSYEYLREFNTDYDELKRSVFEVIGDVLKCDRADIKDLRLIKKGVSNRTFKFICKDKSYVIRVPYDVNYFCSWELEKSVYDALLGNDICQQPIYFNSDNGYLITPYVDRANCCDSLNEKQVKKCIAKLKDFHTLDIKVSHSVDLFEKVLLYENLLGEQGSIYIDYDIVKSSVFSLRDYIDSQDKACCLTHVDAVPENFLIDSEGKIYLIDWEYAGMQDPHIDIAMFCVYSMYSKEEIEKVIDYYFDGDCSYHVRTKLYCYISLAGLLWSNWCEYKMHCGIEFGEYSLKQYRYAKDYYKYAKERIELGDSYV